MDFGPSGTWLRVPLGKLNDERAVPLDESALGAFAEWLAHRSAQRALPHPRDGRLCDFVFVERGRRIGPGRIQQGLTQAVEAAGLLGADGQPLHVVAHQLRHTWATELGAGYSVTAVAGRLGNSPAVLLGCYAHWIAVQDEDQAKHMGQLVGMDVEAKQATRSARGRACALVHPPPVAR